MITDSTGKWLRGASGQGRFSSPSDDTPGFGGRVFAVVPVIPGEKLSVVVGGTATNRNGGFNGGGGGGSSFVEHRATESRMWQGWKKAYGNGVVTIEW